MIARRPNSSCSTCGKEMYRRPCVIKNSEHVYCSKECYRLATKAQAKECLSCKKLFTPEKLSARFCSRSCANTSRRGTTYDKKGYVNLSRRRLQELRNSFVLTQCMIEGCDYDKTLDIHRFIAGKQGGRYEVGNMFAICPNHHAEVTRGLIQLEKLNDFTLRVVKPGG